MGFFTNWLTGGIVGSALTGVLTTANTLLSSVYRTGAEIYNQLPSYITQFSTGWTAYNTRNPTPTIGQMTTASLAIIGDTRNAPPSLRAFTSNGQQMGVLDVAHGLLGRAWLTPANQVIVAFCATDPISPYGRAFYEGQVATDTEILRGRISVAQTEALDFVRTVQAEAARRGINPTTGVFTTGISLGGILAEYVASQTGVGGLGIVSAGLPRSALTNSGPGTNFVNVLAAGDPVSQFDDRFGVHPLSLTQGITHYGLNMHVGSPLLNTALTNLESTLIASMPAGTDSADYFIHSFLGPVDVIAGDVNGLNYMSPQQLAFSSFALTNHAVGVMPSLIADANMTLPQYISAHRLAA